MQWLKDFSLARDMITPDDFDLVRIAATPDEVIETVQKWYIKQEIVGRKFLVPK